MHALIAPASWRRLRNSPAWRRSAERRAPAPPHQPVADVIVDRDQMPIGGRSGDDPPDFVGQPRRHALVGVDLEQSTRRGRRRCRRCGAALRAPRRPRRHATVKVRAISAERSSQRSSTTTSSSANVSSTGTRPAAPPRLGDDQRRQQRATTSVLTPPFPLATLMLPHRRPVATASGRRLDHLDRQRVHQRVGGAVVETRPEHRRAASRGTHDTAVAAPRARIARSDSDRTARASACRPRPRCASARYHCR